MCGQALANVLITFNNWSTKLPWWARWETSKHSTLACLAVQSACHTPPLSWDAQWARWVRPIPLILSSSAFRWSSLARASTSHACRGRSVVLQQLLLNLRKQVLRLKVTWSTRRFLHVMLRRVYPPFRNTARAKQLSRNCFPSDCAKLSQSIAWNNSCGIVLGAIAQFCCCSLLSYYFWTCFQESICAMAILPLHQNISPDLFLAWLRKIRVIIARNIFWGITCVIISERRVVFHRS